MQKLQIAMGVTHHGTAHVSVALQNKLCKVTIFLTKSKQRMDMNGLNTTYFNIINLQFTIRFKFRYIFTINQIMLLKPQTHIL